MSVKHKEGKAYTKWQNIMESDIGDSSAGAVKKATVTNIL